MPYYLRHHFEPDFDYMHLKPKADDAGNIDRYNLGYVQNVVKGQVLAELVPLEEAGEGPLDPRYVYDTPPAELPCGPNCELDPDSPSRVVADANGYVFYHDGLITVKKMLNVRRDVDFHTGNIFFVGDMAIHADVKPGFEIQADNILVKGVVEGAVVRARGAIACESGIKGGKGCLLDAGDTLRVPFAENAELRSHGNMYIERFALHCRIYAGTNLVVKDRVQGGAVHGAGVVYIENQLGGAQGTPTKVNLGYDPFKFRKITRLEENIRDLRQRIIHYEAVAADTPAGKEEPVRRLEAALKKMDRLLRQRAALWEDLKRGGPIAERCRLVVPGRIMPGVEISIEESWMEVREELRDVRIVLRDGELAVESPALPPAHGTGQR
ncbi:FapA family protein [Nitratidesulfovibrio liaohensis]|uniref:FapA family protein n=1 Tax=Nitratidesulfovibrio liaohensis TaxID=2604158 RepID=A0ABY9R5F5_9BACT|nr:FapA family protein [Nitratidesulfovibrio liaohensis]WMW65835.1 FapA family protein [Nitratidesulfovibrio liaohensis]